MKDVSCDTLGKYVTKMFGYLNKNEVKYSSFFKKFLAGSTKLRDSCQMIAPLTLTIVEIVSLYVQHINKTLFFNFSSAAVDR